MSSECMFGLSGLRVAGLSVLIAGLLFFAWVAFAWLEPKPAYATKSEIQQSVDRLNKKLTYLSVTDANNVVTLLNGDGSRTAPPMVQYLVSVQDKYVGQVSIFSAKEYVMPSSPLKLDPTVRDLCGTIDKTLESQDEILKALHDAQIRIPISVSFYGVDVGVEFSPPNALLVELAAILRTLAGVKAKKVEILIKGYADGQLHHWTKPLRPAPYEYEVVNVYPRAEPDRIDSFQFIRIEKPKRIQRNYTNEDLPELRARFVHENFISGFLQGCSGTAETEVHILEGYADRSNALNVPDRKAEIFINIY